MGGGDKGSEWATGTVRKTEWRPANPAEDFALCALFGGGKEEEEEEGDEPEGSVNLRVRLYCARVRARAKS